MAQKEEEEQAISPLPEINTKLRDLEEKQRILKDRVLLVSQSLVDARDKDFAEMQELKKEVIRLKEDNKRMKEVLERMAEQTSEMARKNELAMLQRQFDLFREA